MKTGLVLEGGGMRGMYTIGVLDRFLNAEISFDYVIGVSAGACNGVSFVARQRGRNYRINTKYATDKRYISLSNLMSERSLFGMKFLFETVPDELVPFDYGTFLSSPCEFVTGVTDVKLGRPVYFGKEALDHDTTVLRAAGKTVHLGGNIGKPLLSTLDLVSENDVCVIELSSFQLLSMRCSPDVAVVTNISPNHLDVHRDMAEYVTAKRNVVLHQNGFSRAILSADSEGAAAYAGDVRGTLRWFSRRHPVENGGWMDEKGDLYHSVNGRAVSLMNRSELKLPGLHNVENFLAAASAVWGTATASQICDVGRSFAGVEHRIEFVRNKNGVRWYNDSIATSPTRTVAGLRSFDERLIVIAGGYDKHLSFDPLAPVLLERAKRLILTGQTAGQIEAAVKNAKGFAESGLVIDHASDLAEAVRTANAAARSGDVVILSPACASFDAYENFEARGRHFKELVRGL